MGRILPRYPIYVISKGRYNCCLTANLFVKNKIPFFLVIELQEKNEYISRYSYKRVKILILPFSNLGLGSIPVRNWVKEHATKSGYLRHWIIDDNIRDILRWHKGRRIRCPPNIALAIAEDFTDRYENIAISGLNYEMFGIGKAPPFYLNHRVYSCMLILNSIPYKWRGKYNEDTDLCLQVLSGGWCTVLINVFLTRKARTMTMKGGNTDELYKKDGRLKMARSLQRQWPKVVDIGR